MQFFAELKRRKVIQTAVLYAAFAWVSLQVAELLFEVLEVPPWGLKLVFVLLLIGFPLALLLSWMHQLTPSGLQRESVLPEPAPKPPPAGAPASQTSTAPPSAATVADDAPGDRSIAVLPF